MGKQNPREQSLLRRIGAFLLGGIVILIIGIVLMVLLEVFFDPSIFLLLFCVVVICLAGNLWGRRYGLTTFFGR